MYFLHCIIAYGCFDERLFLLVIPDLTCRGQQLFKLQQDKRSLLFPYLSSFVIMTFQSSAKSSLTHKCAKIEQLDHSGTLLTSSLRNLKNDAHFLRGGRSHQSESKNPFAYAAAIL